jgi:predicted nuclease with TOPRIM domain
MTTGLIIDLLEAEELVKYGKPQTTLEYALFDKLKELLDSRNEWYEVADNYSCCTPEELTSLIESKDGEIEDLEEEKGKLETERDELLLEVERLTDLVNDLEESDDDK